MTESSELLSVLQMKRLPLHGEKLCIDFEVCSANTGGHIEIC